MAIRQDAFGRAISAILRKLNPTDIQGICVLVAIVNLAAMIASYASASAHLGQTAFGGVLGADFAAFYDAGILIDHYGADRLYDLALQAQIYHANFPFVPADSLDQFQNAPFLALPLPLLSRLRYPWALACWQLVSLGLYAGGFTMLWRQLPALRSMPYRAALLAAATYMPFMTECLAGGQTTAFGFFCLAAALALEGRAKYLASGFMIAMLSYKPTLLLLICPMLLISRRWRQIGGLVAGLAILAAASIAFGGRRIFHSWLQALLYTAKNITGADSGLRLWKYVDVNSFVHGLVGTHPAARWLIVAALTLPIGVLLARSWWPGGQAPARYQNSAWSSTLAWLPAINLYMGIYDAALVVLSATLVAAQQQRRYGCLLPGYGLCLAALYVLPWITEPLARVTGVQLYTPVLAVWGIYVLREARRERVVVESGRAQCEYAGPELL